MNQIAIVYWSGTGNTEKMAQAIADGIRTKEQNITIKPVDSWTEEELSGYSKILFGCPSMGAEVLEETEFEPFFSSIEHCLSGKKIGLFGSYGWGDGQWMRDWEKRVGVCSDLFEEGLIVNEEPDHSGLEECKSFGIRFVNA